MKYETDPWKFVQAKWYTAVPLTQPRLVRLIVIHDMEYVERPDSAEIIANDFATRLANNKGSAHICVDNNSIIQCVKDRDVAYAAPGANHDGIQVELTGFGSQSRAQWMDFYGIALLALGSDAVAQYCLKFAIPPVRLTVAQVKDKKTKGICGHADVTAAFKMSTHTDPGQYFPWDYFIQSVLNSYKVRKTKVA